MQLIREEYLESGASSLKHVGDGHVHVALLLPVVVLRPLDDHQVRGEVDSPRHGGSRNQDLNIFESFKISVSQRCLKRNMLCRGITQPKTILYPLCIVYTTRRLSVADPN